MKESVVIAALRKAFPDWGIGDDTAILEIGGSVVGLTCDAAVEGVHFAPGCSTLAQVMEKLVSANVSDINAVGGKAKGFLLAAGLPEGFGEEELDGIIRGLRAGTEFYSIELVGGDTVLSPGGYFFDVSMYGEIENGEAIRRSGAEAGDKIVLFGECGMSAVGLNLLDLLSMEGGEHRSNRAAVRPGVKEFLLEHRRELLEMIGKLDISDYGEPNSSPGGGMEGGPADELGVELILSFVRRHLVPAARPIPDEFLGGYRSHIHAAVDVSDGLALDLGRLASESRVGARVDLDALPVPCGMDKILAGERDDIYETILSSGEEYCIVAAVSPEVSSMLPRGAATIGEFVDGEGLRFVDSAGREKRLDISGFEHTF